MEKQNNIHLYRYEKKFLTNYLKACKPHLEKAHSDSVIRLENQYAYRLEKELKILNSIMDKLTK